MSKATRLSPPPLVSFCGIDGAGKTSLAESLAALLAGTGIPTRVVWGGYTPLLLRPIIGVAKRLMGQRDGPNTHEGNYVERKRSLLRQTILGKVYLRVLLLDYLFGSSFQVKFPGRLGKILICDRYVPDFLVNISPDLGLDDAARRRLLSWLFRWLPQPAIVFLLDVPEEVALARKADTPSLAYLRDRREIYLKLGTDQGYVRLDGTRSRDALLEEVVAHTLEVIGHE